MFQYAYTLHTLYGVDDNIVPWSNYNNICQCVNNFSSQRIGKFVQYINITFLSYINIYLELVETLYEFLK